MTEPAVAVENVGFAYRPNEWVLRGCSASFPVGSVTAFLGPNGCGKTTLLRLLLKILAPMEGAIRVSGRVAFVPQLFRTAFSYTVLEMVVMGRAGEIGLWSQPTRLDEALALAALDRFGLADLAARPFDEISGGQRQLAILARAVVAAADIVVLDEPCAALDLRNQALVLEQIGALADSGLTIIFSTHAPQHVSAIADKVMLMLAPDDQRIGDVGTVLTQSNLERLYGVPMRRVAGEEGSVKIDEYLPVFTARVGRRNF